MKHALLVGIGIVLSAASASAQTSATTQASAPVTMTGCVARASSTAPITLTNPMVIPNQPETEAAALVTPTVTGTSRIATQPGEVPPATGSSTIVPPAGSTAIPGAVAGTAGAAVPNVVGTSGVVGAGTSGVVASPAAVPDLADNPGINGYRLSGIDMSEWVGKRVQIAGSTTATDVTSSTPPATVTAPTSGVSAEMPDFRVVRVTLASGPCPSK